MLFQTKLPESALCYQWVGPLIALIFAATPGASVAEITWNGDFADGNFGLYHAQAGPGDGNVKFFSVPAYGRPINYGEQNGIHTGNGELLSLVARTERTVDGIFYPAGPTRGNSEYAAKFVAKNSTNGIEPDDCDGGSANCVRRRSQLKMQGVHFSYYGALAHMGEWWVTQSFYLPTDWPTSGSGWGPILMGIKQHNGSYSNMGYFSVEIQNNAWLINHHWSDDPNNPGQLPWQQVMFYSGNNQGSVYPNANQWPDGVQDFPDEAVSGAALQSVNIGGWTDWIIHYRQDHRGTADGGTGFLELWKREDQGPWIQVLNILPAVITRGGMTFDRGIGYNLVNSGAGAIIGLYMHKNQVWTKSNDRVVYVANHKIGDSNAEFSDMSPDGSFPDSGIVQQGSPPKPPALLVAE